MIARTKTAGDFDPSGLRPFKLSAQFCDRVAVVKSTLPLPMPRQLFLNRLNYWSKLRTAELFWLACANID